MEKWTPQKTALKSRNSNRIVSFFSRPMMDYLLSSNSTSWITFTRFSNSQNTKKNLNQILIPKCLDLSFHCRCRGCTLSDKNVPRNRICGWNASPRRNIRRCWNRSMGFLSGRMYTEKVLQVCLSADPIISSCLFSWNCVWVIFLFRVIPIAHFFSVLRGVGIVE